MTVIENKNICKELYQECIEYSGFFNDEFKTILNMVHCLMSEGEVDVNEICLLATKLPYFKGMMYFLLSLRAYIMREPNSVIVYGKICENELVEHQNYKRLWILKLNMSSAFNSIKHFGLANSLCEENFISMGAFGNKSGIYESNIMQYYVSRVGLNQDDEILKSLLKKADKTIFEYLILILIKYKNKEKEEIDLYYNEIIKQIDEKDPYYNITINIYEIMNLKHVTQNFSKITGKFVDGYIELLKSYMEVKK